MRTQHIDIYESFTIDDHPDPQLCFNWIREHWHNLADYAGEEMIDSLKALADRWQLDLDYSIAPFGDRGEFISLKPRAFDDCADMSPVRLWKYLHNSGFISADLIAGNCPFTGVCYDEVLIDPIREFAAKPSGDLDDLLSEIAHRMLCAYHAECEYVYSDEAIREMCVANEYQFLENGAIA